MRKLSGQMLPLFGAILLFLSACQITLVDGSTPAMPTQTVSDQDNALASSDAGDLPQTEDEPPAVSISEPIQLALKSRSTGDARPASQIFADLSPSIAFIETPYGTGSGVMIEQGYILSNAHVVWPYTNVRVVFPDGSEHLDVPVFMWDVMADLALIGPIETDVEAVPLVDVGDLEIGSDVYLMGYPAEVDKFPQPSITNGILSRTRTWDALDYSFFQVDATTTGGQSGGILVTYQGDVIGISTFYYSGFGLASSVGDAVPRLNALLAGENVAEEKTRALQSDKALRIQRGTLQNEWDEHLYILQEEVGTEVEITIQSFAGAPQVVVSDLYGYIDEAIPSSDMMADLTFEIEEETPYIIRVFQPYPQETPYTLKSSHPLSGYSDPDDGQMLTMGDTVVGNFDVPEDSDYFDVELAKDEIIQVTVDALGADPIVSIIYESDTLVETVSDDDSGGGLFGSNAQITYQAPRDGLYRIVVDNYYIEGASGYFMMLDDAPAATELTELDASDILISSEHGRLGRYESDTFDFEMLIPYDWEAVPGYSCGDGTTVCYFGDLFVLALTEENLRELPARDQSLEGYTALVESSISFSTQGFELIDNEEFETPQGLTARILEFTIQDGRYRFIRLIYVDRRDEVAFNATFYGMAEGIEQMEPIADDLFETFRSWSERSQERSPIYFVDEAARLLAQEEYDAALGSLTTAIEMDDELAEAYASRAWLRGNIFGEGKQAIEDIDQAISLEPNDAELYFTRGYLRWLNQDYTLALSDMDESLALDEEQVNIHNMRALVNAGLGEYDDALEDVRHFARANDNRLEPSVIDTRAYIYLKMGKYASAMSDYEKVYAQEFFSPYTLLGGAIAYAQLDRLDEARELLEEGLPQAEEIEHPTPQLADLVKMAQEVLAEIEAD